MALTGKTIRQTHFFPGVTATEIYKAMLDGEKHSKMTGGAATCDPRVGGAFTAWDGYISGTILELRPYHEITQEWRTTEWPSDAPPSHLRWTFSPVEDGTKVTMTHSRVPPSQAESYRQGWHDFYWTPMAEYFKR